VPPAWAAHSGTPPWDRDPALSPIERLLAQRIEAAADPLTPRQPTQVVHFHLAVPRPSKPKAGRPHAVPRRTRQGPRVPRATPSFYVRSLSGSLVWEHGCSAGRYRAFGIVVLAFGKPFYDLHRYGTLTFSGNFASDHAITVAMETFARAYVRCLPRGSRAHIALARGTSNYFPSVPSTYRAGWIWARETVALARYLRRTGLARRVSSAAAVDAEPAWNRTFVRTRDFFRGYRAYRPGYALYNYGSLDGGVGTIWNARQVWFVTSGMKYARALPEIYYPWMATQWATMSRIAVSRFGRPLRFAGVMTQHKARCGCGFRAKEAHRALVLALRRYPQTWIRRLPALTNIKWN
jgi:hypothetical protein